MLLNIAPFEVNALEHLERLRRHLEWYAALPSRLPGLAPRGLYIHGGVGVGKTMVMDLFHNHTPKTLHASLKRRVHFHDFMLDVHRRLHELRKAGGSMQDPLGIVATQIARETLLLTFDEFQVTDVADAMILKRLFNGLFFHGVVMVATSNRAPEELYEGGLNRHVFMPFISDIRAFCDVLHITTAEDYRRIHAHKDVMQPRLFIHPLTHATSRELESLWADLTQGIEIEPRSIPVAGAASSRVLTIPLATLPFREGETSIARFTFDGLCSRPLGPVHFIALCTQYGTVFIEALKILTPSLQNETRRFITFIDCAYERSVKVVIRAAVSLDMLFTNLEKREERSDVPEDVHLRVVAEGGASGSLTTMLGNTEWSATGLVGASLADVQTRETSFAYRRAVSRLYEMQSTEYHRRHEEVWLRRK